MQGMGILLVIRGERGGCVRPARLDRMYQEGDIMMKNVDEFVLNHPFFSGMNIGDVKQLVECGSPAQFDAGEVVFRQEEVADRFYIIESGKVAVEIQPGEQKPLKIQTLGPGNILGWSWIFPPYVWHFDARTVEPVEAVCMDARCIREKVEADAALGFELMMRFSRVLLQRLQMTRLQLVDIYAPQVG